MPTIDYPTAPTSDQVDDYHGTRIADPYRPLEDSDSPESREWIAAQNALTERILAEIPARRVIRERLAQVWDYPRAGAPWRRGDRWFQMRNTGLQDQDVLFVADAPDSEGQPLIDPNLLSADGTTALSAVEASDDGTRIAYATSDAGSDWRTWRVRDVASGEDLPDRIDWSKFAEAAWTGDGAGFFYGLYPEPPAGAAYDAPNLDMELRYHRLGTAQSDDPVVLARPDEPEWGFEPDVTDDGRLLTIIVWRGTDPENRLYVADLTRGVDALEVNPLIDVPDASYLPIAAIDGTLYVHTDHEAPNGRIVAIDVASGERREVVAEGPDALEMAKLVGDRLALVYLHDASHRLAIHELDGTLVFEPRLPGIGSIAGLSGRREDPDLYLTFATFAAPASVLAVRMADGTVTPAAGANLAWSPGDFVTEQVFAESADGTRIPLFLTHRRDVTASGEVPTLLYGYGGFQVAIGPMFKPEWLAWMERGGLLAVASLRGGAEYGKAWHDAGRLDNKQNVFDDFAACARWLASSGWTDAAHLGILGRSNGGLLVGASITQHPELFGAAVAEVGVMDMLRF
ncbi:MAG TPA: prolyl oligopeptidase family serine peptidase, partial [Candidatus Limnocylindria bacterium]|nr:prolyl oligopeptidase family serine peptidase [Candidatus Limnocylindria bacterium]